MATRGLQMAMMIDETLKDGENMPEARTTDDQPVPDSQPPKKKKQKKNPHHTLHMATLRKPSWTYFHMSLFSPGTSSSTETLDILTAKRYLTSALQRFLGLHGAAIPVDILKLSGQDVWVRVPREDATVVHEALAGWMGDGVKWNVKRRDEWLARLAMDGAEGGQDLFKP